MNEERILSLAQEIVKDNNEIFVNGGRPSRIWFKSFMNRRKEKYPELAHVAQRGASLLTLGSLNSETINW